MLAGGRSERFGDVDKLTVRMGARTLLERSVAAASAVAADVVVVLPPGEPTIEVPPPARAAHDPTQGEGPLAGVHAGLLAIAGSDVAVVVGGDMPELQPEVLALMVRRLADEPAAEVVALDDGTGPRPLPLVLRTRAATDAARTSLHAGHRRLRDLLGSLRAAVVDEAAWTALDPGRRSLRDVDEPDDLNS